MFRYKYEVVVWRKRENHGIRCSTSTNNHPGIRPCTSLGATQPPMSHLQRSGTHRSRLRERPALPLRQFTRQVALQEEEALRLEILLTKIFLSKFLKLFIYLLQNFSNFLNFSSHSWGETVVNGFIETRANGISEGGAETTMTNFSPSLQTST